MSLPDVVSREEWLQARQDLLTREKELLRQRDALNADRRRLPMVKVDQDYVFTGPDGEVKLADLFDGKRQLIIQHVMLGPEWEQPCSGCTATIEELNQGILDHLASRETTFVLVSRAPYDKIAAVAKKNGWEVPWFSSAGSDFNFDYQVSFPSADGPGVYNYRSLDKVGSDELPGYSTFLRDGEDIYHTYSTFARGTEYMGGSYTFLDITALGRQEEWEEPKGRSENVHGPDPSFSD